MKAEGWGKEDLSPPIPKDRRGIKPLASLLGNLYADSIPRFRHSNLLFGIPLKQCAGLQYYTALLQPKRHTGDVLFPCFITVICHDAPYNKKQLFFIYRHLS